MGQTLFFYFLPYIFFHSCKRQLPPWPGIAHDYQIKKMLLDFHSFLLHINLFESYCLLWKLLTSCNWKNGHLKPVMCLPRRKETSIISISVFYSIICALEEKLFKTKVTTIFVKYRYYNETVQKPHEQQLRLQLSTLLRFASANPLRCHLPFCGPNSSTGPTAVFFSKVMKF